MNLKSVLWEIFEAYFGNWSRILDKTNQMKTSQRIFQSFVMIPMLFIVITVIASYFLFFWTFHVAQVIDGRRNSNGVATA